MMKAAVAASVAVVVMTAVVFVAFSEGPSLGEQSRDDQDARSTQLNSATSTTVSSWDALKTAIGAAKGQKSDIRLTLANPFDMSRYKMPINVQAGVIIDGNGAVLDAKQTTVSTPGQFFYVGDGWNPGALTISNATLTHGIDEEGGDSGGAIQVAKYGEVYLTDVTFAGNVGHGAFGGALGVTKGGSATLTRCVFSNNQAAGGGAVSVKGVDAVATLTDCTFTGNFVSPKTPGPGRSVRFGGGAVYIANNGAATLSGCTFSGNSVPDEYGYQGGGAVYVGEGGGDVLLHGCVFTPPVSNCNNDVGRYDTSAKVTFACADGLSSSPVQMTGTEASVLPPKSLVCA